MCIGRELRGVMCIIIYVALYIIIVVLDRCVSGLINLGNPPSQDIRVS